MTSFDYSYQNALRQAIVFSIFYLFCEESLVRDTNQHYKDCSEMHSGSCSQMTSSCQYPIRGVTKSEAIKRVHFCVCVLLILQVSLSVFFTYIKSLRVLIAICAFLLLVMGEGCLIYSRVWLAQWSTADVASTEQRDKYLGTYGGFGFGQATCILLASLTLASGSITASRNLHLGMLENIMHSPMSFFETTPLGRIVNRFSKDIFVIDETVPRSLLNFLKTFITVVGTVLAISYATPLIMTVLLPLAIIYVFIQVSWLLLCLCLFFNRLLVPFFRLLAILSACFYMPTSSLPPFLPPFLPPSLPSCFLFFLSSCFLSFFSSFLPPSLPPSSLPSFIPSFLHSFVSFPCFLPPFLFFLSLFLFLFSFVLFLVPPLLPCLLASHLFFFLSCSHFYQVYCFTHLTVHFSKRLPSPVFPDLAVLCCLISATETNRVRESFTHLQPLP